MNSSTAITADWRDVAACRAADPEMFFPATGYSPAAAKRVCAACPVRVQCLEFALKHRIGYGVFGGLTEAQRRPLSADCDLEPGAA